MLFKKKKIGFPTEIEIKDEKYEIQLIFSSKKSSSVSKKGNVLLFRLSSKLNNKTAQEHFSTLLRRISKKIQTAPLQPEEKTSDEVIEKGFFYFAKEKYNIQFSNTIRTTKYENNTFYTNYKTRKDTIHKYIIKKLIQIYTPRITKYIKNLNDESYNYKFKNITLKNLKSKWGHCTADNNLMFNLKLLNAPIQIFDYVIYHELSHIKVKNHSDVFWKEVSRFCKNHKTLRKELNKNPPQIFE